MNLIFIKALIKTIEVLQNFEKMMKNRTYSIKILSSKISLYIFFSYMIYFMKHLLKTLLKALGAHKILIQLKNNKKKTRKKEILNNFFYVYLYMKFETILT